MSKAAAKLPLWLPSGEAVGCVARYLSCPPEAAELQIVVKGKGGWVKARGLTVEGWLASPLAAAWRGARGLRTSQFSDEITNLELRLDDLIAAGLLPGQTGRANRVVGSSDTSRGSFEENWENGPPRWARKSSRPN